MPAGHTLLLIRHGIAEERGNDWPDDFRRPLSAAGVERLRRSRGGLARLVSPPHVILTSPLIRTRQTAEIVASAFEPSPAILNFDALAPGNGSAALLSALGGHAGRASIALVGHHPGIGELAARLTGGRRAMDFKKGAVCQIQVDALPPTQPGTLRWFVTPRILRWLSR